MEKITWENINHRQAVYFGVNRIEGVSPLITRNLQDSELNILLVKAIPNGKPIDGMTMCRTINKKLYISSIYQIEGNYSGVIFEVLTSENPFELLINFENETGISKNRIDNQEIFKNIQDLHYVFTGLLLGYKVLVIGERYMYLAFLSELYKLLPVQFQAQLKVLSEGRYQENFDIQAFQNLHRIEMRNKKHKAIIIDLYRNQAYGQISLQISKQMAEQIKRQEISQATHTFYENWQHRQQMKIISR